MTRISSDACWSSDDSSFGWVDMENDESAAALKGSVVEETDADDDSNGDSDNTQFDSECKNRPVLDAERVQKQNLKVSTKVIRGQVKAAVSEDSDSTQLDADFYNRHVREEKIRSEGNKPLAAKEDQFNAPETVNTSHETSQIGISGDSASESSDGSDKKDLKPFTKRLLVKKERVSHALSDGSIIDSPTSRVKAEFETTQQKSKEDNCATLIEGVLLDTAQPLSFDIGADEDVWIVQCPYEVSELTLKGKSLNFSGISCLEQFEGKVLTSNPKPVNLLLPKSPLKLMSVTPSGHIVYKEKEMAPHILHPVCNEDDITSLPTGLKVRHPLFGADVSLVQRLCSPLKKRKKKKKKRDVSELETTFCKDENEVMEADDIVKFSNSLDASPQKKKRKKNKHLDEQTAGYSQDSSIENHNLQMSSFHSDSSPKIPSDKNRNDFVVTDYVQSGIQQKKHKKIKHEPGEVILQEITTVPPELACASPSKKRKHKHIEYSFEGNRQMAGGTSDEAENTLSQKRKKHKYEDKSNTLYATERTDESSFAESSLPISSKKRKHHKYERDFQSECIKSANNKSEELAVCSEALTLDPTTDGLLHTVKKKKKKIKDNDSDFINSFNVETNADVTSISTKKKKKVKMENSDEHFGNLWFDVRGTKNTICDVSGADLDYFDVNIKKLHKEERKKFEERDHSPEFSEENSAHSKFFKHTFNNSLLKQEVSYHNDSALDDVHQKKKKKRKSK